MSATWFRGVTPSLDLPGPHPAPAAASAYAAVARKN
jgi:hypothetical protein